ncbi:MAG TPA: hypothetical protein VGP64_15975 [Polyangia bacterium]|jgi:hypothetical protein
MKNLLAALLLASALGCHATTLIGTSNGIDGGDDDATVAVDAVGCNLTFPDSGFYGPNILVPGRTSFNSTPFLGGPATVYELVVQHDAAVQVTVKLTLLSGDGVWYIGGYAADWRVTNDDGGIGGTQTFEAPNVGGEAEESIYFVKSGRAKLDVLGLCGPGGPMFSKTISWSPADGGTLSPTDGGGFLRDGGGFLRDGGFVPDGGGFVPDGGGFVPDGGGFVRDGGPFPWDSGPTFDARPALDGGIVTGPVGGE